MLYRETIAVCSEIYTKYVHKVCGQKLVFVNVKPCGRLSNWCDLWVNRALKNGISF